MKNPIILLSGGTGVGTSAVSFELAKSLHIPNIVSTDQVREVIRAAISSDMNLMLGKSTYVAGQTVNYDSKKDNEKRLEVIRAYKTQCTAVNAGICAVVRRAINENIPLIVEGVHMVPGKIRDMGAYSQHKDRFMEVLLYIADPEVHRARFEQRQIDAPERPMDKYLTNFREIRWIHDYLVGRPERYCIDDISLVDNSGALRTSVDVVLKAYYRRGKD